MLETEHPAREVKIDELVRLLNLFCQYEPRYIFQKDEKSRPMTLHNYVDIRW